MLNRINPTEIEITFDENDFIVSKTDLRGVLTYCNKLFLDISGYAEDELLGKPHSIIRHPKMPRATFKIMWDHIANGKEFFGYVVNLCKNGSHYWVFAHVTPTFNQNDEIIGYHSNRRKPPKSAIEKIIPIYDSLLNIENNARTVKEGLQASLAELEKILNNNGMKYEEFIFNLQK